MRAIVLATLMACTTSAQASDLWLTVDQTKATESIHLQLPANWLVDAEKPVELDARGGTVDLVVEARKLKGKAAGAERSWTLDADEGPTTVVLRTAKTGGPAATKLEMKTLGPEGNGVTFTMGLDPEQLGQSKSHLEGVLDVEGIEVDLGQALCDQLKASGPTVILSTKGPKGGGVTLETR